MAVNWNRRAMRELLEGAETARFMADVGEQVRDEARRNADRFSDTGRSKAIVNDAPARDGRGVYVDVGYDKTDPGFTLFFNEVGTVHQPAKPHLRPALRPGLLD